jgi:hypothetical protein
MSIAVKVYCNVKKLNHCISVETFLLLFHNRHYPALQRQNAENLKQIFPEKEYRGPSHLSVSELHIPTMGLPFLLEEICGPILGLYV